MNNNTSAPLVPMAHPFDINSTTNRVTQFFYVLTFLLGFFGNVSVIVVVMKKKRRLAKDYFMLHLSVADLMVIVFSIPFRLYHSFALPFSEFSKVLFGKVVIPSMPFTVFLSVYTLVFIAIERHQTILHPLRERMSLYQVLVLLSVTWVFSAMCVSPLLAVGSFDGHYYYELWPRESYRKLYAVGFFIFQYVIPLSVVILLYLRIAIFLRQQKTKRRKLTVQRGRSDRQRKQNVKIYKMFAVIILVFALCNFPTHLVWLIAEFSTHGFSPETLTFLVTFCDILLTFNSCTNPIIYGLSGIKLSQLYMMCFGKKNGKENNTTFRVRAQTSTVFTRLSPTINIPLQTMTDQNSSNATMCTELLLQE